jgi:hypothetical protein
MWIVEAKLREHYKYSYVIVKTEYYLPNENTIKTYQTILLLHTPLLWKTKARPNTTFP